MKRLAEMTFDEIASERIMRADVKETQHGWRVECRTDLGDDRSVAGAYWPKQTESGWHCECWAKNTHGTCSHIVAFLRFIIGDTAVHRMAKKLAPENHTPKNCRWCAAKEPM